MMIALGNIDPQHWSEKHLLDVPIIKMKTMIWADMSKIGRFQTNLYLIQLYFDYCINNTSRNL